MKTFYDLYQITSYNDLHIINKIKNSNIPVSDFHKIDKYTYIFKSSFFYRKKIRKAFPFAKIVKSKGLFAFFHFLIMEKATLISIIIASFYFVFISSKIWKIEIKGQYENINQSIIYKLEDNKLKKGENKPSFKKLKDIENNIYNEIEKDVEWLELSLKGSVLYVNYIKRRIAPEKERIKGKLYASKDGIIKRIDVSKGNVLVKEDQFVRKGDLLVDDYLISSDNNSTYLGVIGNIYAYTWYILELEYKTSFSDPFDVFYEAYLKALNVIEKDLSPNEQILKENILQYTNKNNIISLKIHFTLYEMIGEEVKNGFI